MSPGPLNRILVVDDEPDILWVTRLALTARGGFDVEVCPAGGQAVEMARRFRPDLILLDVMMPEMDGPATLQALRAEPETAAIPVVFMTAKAMPQETARYLELGAIGVIAKPFDQRTLATELERIAGGRRSDLEAVPDGGTAELFDAYAGALPAKIDDIRQCWQRVDVEHANDEDVRAFERLVHRLGGTAETYGFASVSRIAARIEQSVAEAQGGALTPTGRERIRSLIGALETAALETRATPRAGVERSGAGDP